MKKKSPQPELPKIAQVWKFILEKKYLSTNLWFQGAVHKSVPFQPQLKGERNFYSGKLSWKKVFFCKDGKWRQSFCNYRVITKVFLRIGFMTDSLPFMIFMNQFIVTQNLITALTGDKYFDSDELIANLKWVSLPILMVQKGKGCEGFFSYVIMLPLLITWKTKKNENYLTKKVAQVKKGLDLICSVYTYYSKVHLPTFPGRLQSYNIVSYKP